MPTFYTLLAHHGLEIPTTLEGVTKVQKTRSNSSSKWGAFDFTAADEQQLRAHLEGIYQGRITAPFLSNFVWRFLKLHEHLLPSSSSSE